MDLWDRDAIDLLGPAFIDINADGTGAFRFIAVEGHLDCRFTQLCEDRAVEFLRDGDDEGDPVSGRGLANFSPDGSLHGHLFFHMRDDSGLRATRYQVSNAPGGLSPLGNRDGRHAIDHTSPANSVAFGAVRAAA